MLVLAICLRILKRNLVITLVMYVLLYLTRPEFLVIPLAIEPLLWILNTVKFKHLNSILFKLNTIIFAIVFLFTCINSGLITRNIDADLSLWICLIASILLFFVIPVKFLKFGKEEFKLLNVTLLVSTALMVTYYWFNPEISRYIVTLIPLFAIICGLGVYHYFLIAKVKSIKYIGFSLIALSLLMNVAYFIKQPRLEAPEYHTEVATKVLDYAKSHNLKEIYVGQEEAYIWVDQNKDFDIIPLDNLNVKDIPLNSMLVIDPSIPYTNATFDAGNLPSLGFTMVDSFNTNAPFRINNDVSSGYVELWTN